MAAITAACTCTVNGGSGTANASQNGYTFTGCGAHVGYTYSLLQGAGYDTTWCYVTSPKDCPDQSPYVPDGLKVENTLFEWEEEGAAWKECYDGYRCEAWWGDLAGSPQGEPVVLNAPLDWPDCCALCSETTREEDGTAACAAWSFNPSTGSCQLVSTVGSVTRSPNEWGISNTIHGYPGRLEAPVSDCWGRSDTGLCWNITLMLLIPGIFLAFASLCCVYFSAFRAPSKRSSLLKDLLDPQASRIAKAACLEVTVTRTIIDSGKAGYTAIYTYEGTFMTRDGAIFVVPVRKGASIAPQTGRKFETKMLSVLFSKNLHPLADPEVARRCETPKGLRSEFRSLVRGVRRHPVDRSSQTVSRPEQEEQCPRFDCLLLVGGDTGSGGGATALQVFLVGILGEDSITCIDAEALGFSKRDIRVSFCFLTIAVVALTATCVALLTNEAAQLMASSTFEGTNHRVGAVIGLALCASVPIGLYARAWYGEKKLVRLLEGWQDPSFGRRGNFVF